jgi:iron-sulfur cluster repair protein YtfE (RIC family)
MRTPTSLEKEHHDIRSLLERATSEQGQLGESARALADKLLPHLRREEEFALPPLGLLTVSGSGSAAEVDEVIALTERLAMEIASLLEDHVEIIRATKAFAERAVREGRDDYVAFAEDLVDHARMEEEIMYPAALLVGSYLRLRRAEKVRSN